MPALVRSRDEVFPDTMLKSGNMSAGPTPPESTTGLLLKRALRFAASGIATMEPAPKSRRTNPMVLSPRWQRVFAKGTKGAQQATPKPAATNASLVDSFARDRYKPSVMKIPVLGCIERDATYGCPMMTLGPALEKVETISSDVPDSRTTWSRTASAAT
jgi:hypothetical protein